MALKTKKNGGTASTRTSRKEKRVATKRKVSPSKKVGASKNAELHKTKSFPRNQKQLLSKNKAKSSTAKKKVKGVSGVAGIGSKKQTGLAVQSNAKLAKKGNAVTARRVARSKVESKKADVPKVVSRTMASGPADWATVIENKIANVRNDFKKTLKAEVAAAFDVCLSAMEQAANLMESRLVTVLGEMSNLVTGAKPDFRGGKLNSVVSDDGTERTDFSYGNDGLVTSRTYRNGMLKFEIVHGKFGNPLSGKVFDPSGKVVKEFSYGSDGQVK